jgi:hypothetical protein
MDFKKYCRVRFSVGAAFLIILAMVAQLPASDTTQNQRQYNAVDVTRVSGLMETTKTVNLTCQNRICAAGTYEVHYNMGVIGANTAGSATLAFIGHDGYASRTQTSSAINTATTSGYTGGTFIVETAGTGNMTAGITIGSVNGSANMYWTAYIRRIR